MNKLFLCAVALGLLVSVPAAAQGDDHNGDKRDSAASHGDRGSAPSGNHQNDRGSAPARQQGHGGFGNAPAKSADMNQNTNRGGNAGRVNTRGVVARPAADNSADSFLPKSGDAHPDTHGRSMTNSGRNNTGMTGHGPNRQPATTSRQGNPGWSGNAMGHQTDFSSMRRNMQAPKHFRSGSYSAPQGYRYRHWSYGERLPRGYFVRNYWIGNFMMFGLFAPPSDLVWVRVGDDALLIDRDSGEIVQVRYGVFY